MSAKTKKDTLVKNYHNDFSHVEVPPEGQTTIARKNERAWT